MKKSDSIKEAINALDIKEDYKLFITSIIEAEIFLLQRIYSPTIIIYKGEYEERVFVELQLELEPPKNEYGIFLFQCRPFIDKGCTLKVIDSKCVFKKAYFIYNQPSGI